MTPTDLSIFAMVALIAINQFLIRSKVWHKYMWVFWMTQLLNSSLGSYALLFGLPGLENQLDVINWLIGLLFLYHLSRNHLRLQRYLREKKIEERDK